VAPEQREFVRKVNREEKLAKRGGQQESRRPQEMKPAPKWKLQSMQFRMAMQAGRQINQEQ